MHVTEGRPVIFYLVLRAERSELSEDKLEEVRRSFLPEEGQEERYFSDRTGIMFSFPSHLASAATNVFVSVTYGGVISILLIDYAYPFDDPSEDFSKFCDEMVNRIRKVLKTDLHVLRKEMLDLGPRLGALELVRLA